VAPPLGVEPPVGVEPLFGGVEPPPEEGELPAVVVIKAVELLITDAPPPGLLAETATRIVEPASAGTSVYAFDVAPVIGPQLAPSVLHRFHW
jgi:hypothetical protein